MKIRSSLVLLCLFISGIGHAQVKDSLEVEQNKRALRKQVRKAAPTFFISGLGVNSLRFRDFATSPLIYQGTSAFLTLGREKRFENRIKEFEFSYNFGLPKAKSDRVATRSQTHLFFLNTSRLFKIKEVLPEKWDLDAGFLLSSALSFRYNPSLQNNSFGYEYFFNVMGSARVSRDISRVESQTKKLWFLKLKLKPKDRVVSFRFDPGIMNNSVRNGFAYIGQSAILNDIQPFDDYKVRLFSGLRFRTVLSYTRYLDNGNGLKLSYIWDAYRTGKRDYDRFELANHIFGFSLLFKTK